MNCFCGECRFTANIIAISISRKQETFSPILKPHHFSDQRQIYLGSLQFAMCFPAEKLYCNIPCKKLRSKASLCKNCIVNVYLVVVAPLLERSRQSFTGRSVDEAVLFFFTNSFSLKIISSFVSFAAVFIYFFYSIPPIVTPSNYSSHANLGFSFVL